VPHVGAAAKQLYVFQRTPSSISVRDNVPTDAQWAKALGEKWQDHRVVNFI
jgi:cation diffusion facilitator CzcD-associated flavoprotein CzcO